MAIAVYSTYAPVTDPGDQPLTKYAEQIAARVNAKLVTGPPEGGIYHAEGPTNDGHWWTFDVWASLEDMQRFRNQILMPILAEVGVQPAGKEHQLDVWWDSSQRPGSS